MVLAQLFLTWNCLTMPFWRENFFSKKPSKMKMPADTEYIIAQNSKSPRMLHLCDSAWVSLMMLVMMTAHDKNLFTKPIIACDFAKAGISC